MIKILFQNVSFQYPDMENPVFHNLNLELPGGITSLIGQNGTGKSTLLLLAGGSLLPVKGRIFIEGIDTADLRDERKRQEYISFVFQNMEFETDETIESLLNFVYENGFHEEKSDDFIRQLIAVFELGKVLAKKTQEISKGELQRTILAFSLLYGSKILLLDEPIFALEQYQKENAMRFLSDYAVKHKISIFYSVHELDISEKYSDYILLFYKHKTPELGLTREMFVKEKIEQAYEVPFSMLKKKDSLYREWLKS